MFSGLTSWHVCTVLIYAILFKSLLYQGSDFLFLQTLVGIFLSMDCSMPDLKESHKFSTVEEGGALVISLESRSMSTKMLSQFALEKMNSSRGFCLTC